MIYGPKAAWKKMKLLHLVARRLICNATDSGLPDVTADGARAKTQVPNGFRSFRMFLWGTFWRSLWRKGSRLLATEYRADTEHVLQYHSARPKIKRLVRVLAK
jgi:hypothetical protein